MYRKSEESASKGAPIHIEDDEEDNDVVHIINGYVDKVPHPRDGKKLVDEH